MRIDLNVHEGFGAVRRAVGFFIGLVVCSFFQLLRPATSLKPTTAAVERQCACVSRETEVRRGWWTGDRCIRCEY